ncbi:MAG: ATP-binding protein [Lachnospiraceae bacterium]|nr:ATP-binding protein [Lachnospiraceae bacterium]
MGYFLNSMEPVENYRIASKSKYFVDKSLLLSELFPFFNQSDRDICITRPRRFGKTMMAQMIASFFSKVADSSDVFDHLRIAEVPEYRDYLNQYQVIFMDFSKMPRNCKSYAQYIERIEKRLIRDLMKAYPEADIDPEGAAWEALSAVFNEYNGEKFVFVIDEWDCIFHKDFLKKDEKQEFIDFLAGLIKNQAYVAMTYMTGILPIAKSHQREIASDDTPESKDSVVDRLGESTRASFPSSLSYSSGSTINNFLEYTISTQSKFSEYFGFTEQEVDVLYEKFLEGEKEPLLTRESLREWYDGYHTLGGVKLYNPRSVVYALTNNRIASYWTGSGPYSEVKKYIVNDIAGVKTDVALMIEGEAVPANVMEYAAASMELQTKNEIFSAMLVYGFLNYENGCVSIPNRELMEEFRNTISNEASYDYLRDFERESRRILERTLALDADAVAELLGYIHDTESPHKIYLDETELSSTVKLAYLAARGSYRIEQEDQAGKGYADFIFYPRNGKDDGLILELKVDRTPDAAIKQIRDKNYALRFQGRIGEQPLTTGRILAVGISCQKGSKTHRCKIEVL